MSEKNLSHKHFQKSLEIWSHYYPKEAVLLPYHEAQGYRMTPKGLVGPKGAYPTEDPEAWFRKIPFQDERVLVVYGLGWGEMFPPLEKWLKKDPDRRVFFFEEDPGVLVRFFETAAAPKILAHPQVEVHFFKELSDKEPAFENFYWSNVLMKTAVAIHPAYQKWHPKRAFDFENKVKFILEMKNALVEEYVKYGISFYRNFYFNVLELAKAKPASALWGRFKNVPAIICGAGPSLEKQIPFLKELKDKALIIAGGSSLNALSFGGVLPHFSTALDPNQEQAVRIRTNNAAHLPFLYRNRAHVEALSLIKGPKLYVVGSGGFEVSDFFEERLGIENEFIDEGHNVINFLCEIVTRLGCNPIIFVGLDLAYTDLKSYSTGVVKEVKLTPETLPKTAILHTKPTGEQIWTEWKWLGEAKWIEEYAKEHPDFTFINATEGGLGIAGIEAMPLKKVIPRYLKKSYRLDSRLQKGIEKACFKGVTKGKIKKLMQEMLSSLEKVIKSLEALKKDAQKRMKKDPLAPQPAALALLEMELIEEPGYQYVLDIFNRVWGAIQNPELRRLRQNKDNVPPEQTEREKLRLQNERIDFILKAAKVNSEIIRLALK